MTDTTVDRIINVLDSMKERMADLDNDYICRLFPHSRHINTYRIRLEVDKLIDLIEKESK
jgi:hypothetical protein